MTDSSKSQTIERCLNMGLSDLGGLEEFDSPGVVGKTYALQLTDLGIYKRKEIDKGISSANLFSDAGKESSKYIIQYKDGEYKLIENENIDKKLEDLNNVRVIDSQIWVRADNDGVYAIYRKRLRDKLVYTISNLPKWILNIRVTPRHTILVTRQHFLKKITNEGISMVSYKPPTLRSVVASKLLETPILERYKKLNSIQPVFLSMVDEFEELETNPYKVGNDFVLELLLGFRPDNFVTILPGLKIKWKQVGYCWLYITYNKCHPSQK